MHLDFKLPFNIMNSLYAANSVKECDQYVYSLFDMVQLSSHRCKIPPITVNVSQSVFSNTPAQRQDVFDKLIKKKSISQYCQAVFKRSELETEAFLNLSEKMFIIALDCFEVFFNVHVRSLFQSPWLHSVLSLYVIYCGVLIVQINYLTEVLLPAAGCTVVINHCFCCLLSNCKHLSARHSTAQPIPVYLQHPLLSHSSVGDHTGDSEQTGTKVIMMKQVHIHLT